MRRPWLGALGLRGAGLNSDRCKTSNRGRLSPRQNQVVDQERDCCREPNRPIVDRESQPKRSG